MRDKAGDLGSRSALLVVFAGLLAGCESLSDSACANHVLFVESSSADGSHTAVIFTRDCGATTGFSTQVSIQAGTGALTETPGNVFIADTNHGRAPAGEGGGPQVRIYWRTPHHLLIQHHQNARVFLAATKQGIITIEYEAFSNGGV